MIPRFLRVVCDYFTLGGAPVLTNVKRKPRVLADTDDTKTMKKQPSARCNTHDTKSPAHDIATTPRAGMVTLPDYL
jgi:hypothetical protein